MDPWAFGLNAFVTPTLHRWEFEGAGVGICGGLGFVEGVQSKGEGPAVVPV